MAPTLPAKSRKQPPSPAPEARLPERRRNKEPTLPSRKRKAPLPAQPPPLPGGKRRRKAPLPLPEAKVTEPTPSIQPATKKHPVPFQRTWPPGDEVRILEALAAHRRAHHGRLPDSAELFAALDGRLDRKPRVGAKELSEKKRSLKRRYDRDAMKAAPPADDHERRLYFLSRDVWGANSPRKPQIRDQAAEKKSASVLTSKDTAQAKSAGDLPLKPPTAEAKKTLAPRARTLAEMHQLYPCLVDEAMVIVDRAVLEGVLPGIDDGEAQALDRNIKNMRMQLTKAITESARMKNMEMPTLFICPSTKLQPEKLRAENKNNLSSDGLDKTDDFDTCAQGQLARVEHEIMELRQIVIASLSQAKIQSNPRHYNSSVKGIRCESAGSGLQSIVAENQIRCNILQKKVEAPNNLSHGKDEEVTSKYYCALPRNVLRNNKLQGMLPPKGKFHGRTRKIDAESQTPLNAVGKEVILLSIVRPHIPVAKAILQPSSQSSIVGGLRLGTQCCMVFVTDVLQGDAPLLRPYGNMKMMLSALKCSIAWPREQIRGNTSASMAPPVQPSRQGH